MNKEIGGPLNATNSIVFGVYFQSEPFEVKPEKTGEVQPRIPTREIKSSGSIYVK